MRAGPKVSGLASEMCPSMTSIDWMRIGRRGPVRSCSRDSRLTSAPRSHRPSGSFCAATYGRVSRMCLMVTPCENSSRTL
jgi:hypothetical protein